MNMKRNNLRLSFVLLALASIWADTSSFAQTSVRFGSVGGLTDAGLYIADELGYFADAGVKVEMKRMANAPTLLAAIATNQLDVVGISITPGLFTAVKQGIMLKIVGDKQSIRPGFAATRLVVRKEIAKPSVSETLSDLKGRKIAISSRLSAAIFTVMIILEEQGLSLKDVDLKELTYPNMVTALSTGAVDAALIIEPFLSQIIKSGIAIDVSNVGEAGTAGVTRTSVPLIYSEAFARNKQPAQGFMDAYVKGVRIYNDAFVKNKDRDKVIGIIARRAGVPEEIVRNGFPAGLDPNQSINLATFEEIQKFFVSQGFLKNAIDLTTIVDESFAKASVAKLGPYN